MSPTMIKGATIIEYSYFFGKNWASSFIIQAASCVSEIMITPNTYILGVCKCLSYEFVNACLFFH